MKKILAPLLLLTLMLTSPNIVVAQTAWPMSGANPQRTSWINTTIPNDLHVKWVKPFVPHIQQKAQLIAAEGKIFVSTAKGLYAINADTGADTGTFGWVYPTELPLGESPTYANEGGTGYLYVGGFDRVIYKIKAADGQLVWKTLPASGGFSTNPLVVDGRVIAANRDGKLYAYSTSNGSLLWQFTTNGPFYSSPAYLNGVVYAASNDMFAYAVNATSGAQIWKSNEKLPGQGFHSWWPVIYQNYVAWTTTDLGDRADTNSLLGGAPNDAMPGVLGNLSGPWPAGENTLNLITNPNGITYADYFENHLGRRSIVFLNQSNGQKVFIDIDGDGKEDGAPVGNTGDAGTLGYPVVNGSNNVFYIRSITSAKATGGGIDGALLYAWDFGTSHVSLPLSQMAGIAPHWPSDEPNGISSAGSKIFWNHTTDRFVGAVDISQPNTTWPVSSTTRQWRYVNGAGNIPAPDMPVGYHLEAVKFFWDPASPLFWGENDKVGPTPYNGKLYVMMSNAVVAFSTDGVGQNAPVLPSAQTVSVSNAPSQPTATDLISKLESQVQAIVNSGHLKPSYYHFGLLTFRLQIMIDDHSNQYWHNPFDTFYVLLRALPYLSPSLQQSVKTYLASEYTNFSPTQYSHVGYAEGTQRDPFVYPPYEPQTSDDIYDTNGSLLPKQTNSGGFKGWTKPPHNTYAVWKAAQAGIVSPATAFTQISGYLSPTIDETKIVGPHVRNAYLTGLKGFIELAKLANNGQLPSAYTAYQTTYTNQLNLRANEWTDFPTPNTGNPGGDNYFYSMLTAWNFLYLTPEVITDLKALPNMQSKMQATVAKYQAIAPHWMLVHNGETQGENAIMPYQQTHTLFQAKALINNEPFGELVKYLDSPLVSVGDLYYIDNLVTTLNTGGTIPSPTPPPTGGPTPTPITTPGDTDGDNDVDIFDYSSILSQFGQSGNLTADVDPYPSGDNDVDIFDFNLVVTNFGV